MIVKFADPLDACRAVVAEAYRNWLQYDDRTDDITMILAYIDRDIPASMLDAEGNYIGEGAPEAADEADEAFKALLLENENRPVRRGLSKAKKKAMAISTQAVEDEDTTGWVMEVVEKTRDELERIQRAVKANFLFRNLTDKQAKRAHACPPPPPPRARSPPQPSPLLPPP